MFPGEKAGLESWTPGGASGWTARLEHRCLDTQETRVHSGTRGEGRFDLSMSHACV